MATNLVIAESTLKSSLPTTTSPAMAGGKSLLQLPTEMLLRVSTFVDAKGLCALRLTCKELGIAAFDAFAAEYLHSLICYFMDPERVDRLEYLVSITQLARKIRHVELTLDIREGRPVEEIRGDAPGGVQPKYQGYPSECEHVTIAILQKEQPDASRIFDILAIMKPRGIRLAFDSASHQQCPRIRCALFTIYSIVFDTMSVSSYPLYALTISSMETRRRRSQCRVLSAQLSSLERLTYTLNPCDRTHTVPREYSHLLLVTLAAAPNLRYLDITVDIIDAMEISAALPENGCLSKLQELRISGLGMLNTSPRLSYEAISSFLEGCTSVRRLSITHIFFLPSAIGQSCYEILQLIRALPDLENLDLGELITDERRTMWTKPSGERVHCGEGEQVQIYSRSREDTVEAVEHWAEFHRKQRMARSLYESDSE